jgi:hypothetical protein
MRFAQEPRPRQERSLARPSFTAAPAPEVLAHAA